MKLIAILSLFSLHVLGVFGQSCEAVINEIEVAFKENKDPAEQINYFEKNCPEGFEKLKLLRIKQFRVRGEIYEGLKYAEQFISKEAKGKENLDFLLEVAILHFLKSEYELTIPICYNILKTSTKESVIHVKSLSMLANAHWKLGNDTYAEKYFRQSLNLAKEINDSSLISVAFNGIGLIEYAKGRKKNLRKASFYLEKSIAFSNGANLSEKNNLAAVYYQLKDYDKADELFRECLGLAKEIGDTSTTVTVLNNLGSIALIRNNLAAANDYLNESLLLHRIFRDNESPPSELLLSLSDLNYAKGNYRLSRDYYEQYASASLNLLNTERNQAMIEMQEKYEALNKKKEINDLKISKQRSELSNLRLQNFIAFLTIFFIVFISILFLIIYLKRKKDRSQKLIELKRAELEASENEKLRISRELHDGLGGTFTVLSLLLNQQRDLHEENEVLIKMRDVIDIGTVDLRQLCRDIYPQGLKIAGLVASLNDLFVTLNNRQHSVQFNLEFDSLDFESGFSINFYRIAQELANNTLKYSNGSRAILTGKMQNRTYRIEYRDNGIGIDDKNIKIGVGLNSILERTRSYFGKVSFEKEKNADSGFYITIEFHLDHILT